ncbi:MAG: hypothetical protein R2764_01605 [Bacteroidales bacterium]
MNKNVASFFAKENIKPVNINLFFMPDNDIEFPYNEFDLNIELYND